MTVTITRTPSAGAAIAPAFRAEYASSQAGQNRLHVLANGGLDVTLYPAGLAAGSLVLLYEQLADAMSCRAAHAAAGVFTLVDDDVPAAGMRYVVAPGDQSLLLAKADTIDDGSLWQVTIAYQQVP